jgi:signal transduction histidine kinase
MSFANLRVSFGTLRARLTLWNTLVLLALVALTLVGVREGLRMLLLGNLDAFLEEEMAEAQDDIREQSPRWQEIYRTLDHKALDHPRRRMFVQVFGPSGELLWSSDRTPQEEWAGRLAGPMGRPVVVGEYRLLERRLAEDGRTVRVGVSGRRAADELAQFTQAMLVVGGVVLLVIPGAGYLLAGRATRPLSKIIDTAGRLHPAQLDERLAVRGAHDELDRLSQTINGLLDRIARYIKQSRDFNAHAAHELRTPLAAIQSSIEVTLLGDRTVDEYKEELMELLEQFDHLRVLVNQLLLLAEGDDGHLCALREPVRLDLIVGKSAEMFQAVYETKCVALRVERLDPALVSGDASALRQLANNLRDNAIKHTPAGGSVALEVVHDVKSGECVLRVCDTGTGIPAADLPHIFQRFYRADKARGREQGHGGTGLGLSICQAIAEAHDGSITAQSRPGEGATFTVRLPAMPSPVAES